jgi:RimJ/RimL family protein N-acetyltransferase
MLTVRRYPDARAFLARAEPWLLDAEIERAGPLSSARQASADDSRYERPMYWATIEDGDEIIGCAYRTPPFRVGVSALPKDALAPLTLDLEQVYRHVTGFSGIDPAASALADIWLARHGGTSAIVSRSFLFSLGEAPPPRGLDGTLRAAIQRDAALAKEWGDAAARDSGITPLDGNLCVRLIGAGQLYLYDADGAPRCLLGLLHNTPRAASLAIVYTPAAERRRGYARAASAALASRLAARGVAKRYFHFDPSNRGAQVLAQKLGGELVQAGVDIDFR